jgi:transforming growth factor-beta-induced protein
MEIVASDPDLSSFASALAAAGIADALNDTTSFPTTLFAPTNAAFAALQDQGYLAKLLTPPYAAHLQSLLRLHMVLGSRPSSSLSNGLQVTAGNGDALIFNVANGTANTVTIESPKDGTASVLLEADIQAANGVVHKVDGVLTPSFIGLQLTDLPSTGSFGIMSELIEESGFTKFIRHIDDATALIPTDDAFSEEALEFYRTNTAAFYRALTEHVIFGVHPVENLVDNQTLTTFAGTTVEVTKGDNGEVLFGGTLVKQADILVQNGIGHAVEKILSEIPSLPPDETLAEIITSDPDFSILASAIATAGLLEPLRSSTADPLTVFAPINTSFGALDQSYWTKLLTPPYVAHMQSLLRLHIVESSLITTGLISDGMQVIAGNGETLAFSVDDNNVTIEGPAGNASILSWADSGLVGHPAKNGIVHKVEGLLLPEFVENKLLDVALAEPSFKIINELLDLRELALQFPDFPEATLLAPIDDAFGEDEHSFIQELTGGNFDSLWSFVNKWIIYGSHPIQNLENGQTLTTIGGTTVTVTKGENDDVFFNDALVTKPNMLAQNGIIHAVDKMLFDFDPTLGPRPSPTPGPTLILDVNETDHGITAGAIVGISFGVIIGIVLLVGPVYFLTRHNKGSRENGDEDLPVGEPVTSVIAHPIVTSAVVQPMEQDASVPHPAVMWNEGVGSPAGRHDTCPGPRFKDQVLSGPQEMGGGVTWF